MTHAVVRAIRPLLGAALLLSAAGAVASAARTAGRARGIEVEGYPTAISAKQGSFRMTRVTDVDVAHGKKPTPPFKIVTTARTQYELADDSKVTRGDFFRTLKSTDKVEVKGYLNGKTITAYKIEIED